MRLVFALAQVLLFVLVSTVLLPGGAAVAQDVGSYKDYPQPVGVAQTFAFHQLPSWMTIAFDVRGRSEGQTEIGSVAGNGYGYELTRVWGSVDLRETKWLNMYAQFHDAHVLTLPLADTAANMRDSFDVRQMYTEFDAPKTQIFVGRQELKFGGERLVGIDDWTNVSRTFDAVDGRFGGVNHVDLFSSSVVVVKPTAMDRQNAGFNFHGAYGVIATLVPHTTIEPYVFVKAMPWVESQQSSYGTETEVTPGTRVVGTVRGGFEYVAEGALQRGSYVNDSIHAGAGYLKAGYFAKKLPWRPRLLAEYDYATGNPHRNADRISTFDQLYPSAHNVLGLVDLFGWQNVEQTRFHFDLTPLPHLSILLQEETLKVANVHDGVYDERGGTMVASPTGGFLTKDIGQEFDASAMYVCHDSVVIQSGVGHFFPGLLMTENQHGTPLTIAYLALTYHFQFAKHSTD
jgi:hypothetical protein